jgi:hypothetical protein
VCTNTNTPFTSQDARAMKMPLLRAARCDDEWFFSPFASFGCVAGAVVARRAHQARCAFLILNRLGFLTKREALVSVKTPRRWR